MDVKILHVADCPNVELARQRLQQAAEAAGVDVSITTVLLETDEDAARYPFHGSPTLVIDGRDPFAAGGVSGGLACRVYRSASGVEGAPSLARIIEALEEARS